MAHFAELNENNVVTNVLVVDNSVLLDENNQESEALGIAYLQNLFGSDKKYKQTSYNQNFRNKYAGIGYEYNETDDVFVFKPFDSWTYSSSTKQYEPPIVRPDGEYFWDEDEYQADNTKGWKVKPDA